MELQEKIDQYLLDQLNPADKIKFEELMAGDVHLKSEVALQKSIVTALGNTSSLQLKSRLQKMPVSMASTGNVLRLKWMGVAAVGTVAAGLIIFLLTGQEKTDSSEASPAQQMTTVEVTPAVVPTKESTTLPVAEKQAHQAQQEVVVKKQANSGVVSSNEIKAFDNSANFDDSENGLVTTPNAENSTAPANTLYTETNNKLSNLSVNVDNSNSKDKSYQFTGSKLTLFGDFNDKPYELLELNNKGQKNLFLSYDNEYYELVWGQTKKTPLKKVSHKETLAKLKVINP